MLKKKNESMGDYQDLTTPGQQLKHYSPNVACKILLQRTSITEDSIKLSIDWDQIALVDFAGKYFSLSLK